MEQNGEDSWATRGTDRRRFLRSVGATATALTFGVGSVVARTGSGVSQSEQTIASWDGTELETTLFTPSGSGPHPAVLMTHGWGASRKSEFTSEKAVTYAENGYTVLTYDSRGFGDSDGTVGFDGPRETKDAQTLIDWLARRPEVATEGAGNPKLGMDGISYAGGIQYQVAAADDRVDAIVPRITWNDLIYSFTPNGVVKSAWLTLLLGSGVSGTVDGDLSSELTDRLYDWYKESLWDNEMPDDAADAFEQRSVAYKNDFDTPAYIIQGWDDTLFNTNEALWTYEKLQAAGVDSRLAFYNGGHSATGVAIPSAARAYTNDRAVEWMNKHVRGLDEDIPQTASWLKQRDTFRTDSQFPPADVSRQTYELRNASRDGENFIDQWNWFADTEVSYSWSVDSDIEIVGQPQFEFTFDVEEDEARLFFSLEHNGEAINDMVEAYRIPDDGTQQIQFGYPPLQRFVSAGDTLGVTVSVSHPFYIESRESDGVTVQTNESRIHIPQRPRY